MMCFTVTDTPNLPLLQLIPSRLSASLLQNPSNRITAFSLHALLSHTEPANSRISGARNGLRLCSLPILAALILSGHSSTGQPGTKPHVCKMKTIHQQGRGGQKSLFYTTYAGQINIVDNLKKKKKKGQTKTLVVNIVLMFFISCIFKFSF